MNKQQFLDKTPNSNVELATQRIICSHSKTHLLQLERAIRNLDTALYSTTMKRLTLTELYAAITFAKSLVCDTEQESSTSISTQEKQ